MGGRLNQGARVTHPQRSVDFLLGHPRASQVHTCLDADQLLASLDELGRELRCSSTCVPVQSHHVNCVILNITLYSPCDVYEFRSQRAHALDTVEKVLQTLETVGE